MYEAQYLAAAIRSALDKKSKDAANIFDDGSNIRDYQCSVPECGRNAYANKLCNAHYIRDRAGKDLNTPVRARKRNDKCEKCGQSTGAKGGWGLCAPHYKRSRYSTIKDALIDAMGGKCAGCGGTFHRRVFDFHHLGNKDGNPSTMLGTKSVAVIASEMSKCKLLCANCHRMEHENGL